MVSVSTKKKKQILYGQYDLVKNGIPYYIFLPLRKNIIGIFQYYKLPFSNNRADQNSWLNG